MKPFPLPVRAIGPGSLAEDETLDYLTLPQGMATYAPPRLPDAVHAADHPAALAALEDVHAALQRFAKGEAGLGETLRVDLTDLPLPGLALINQVLGEGEVAAQIDGIHRAQVQESVFAGVWRVVVTDGAGVLSDYIEIGAIPTVIAFAAAQGDALPAAAPAADGVMNAPALLEEIADKVKHFRTGTAAHVINLSLLPLSPADRALIDGQLGTGRVTILSRGYGNCRITNTAAPFCWRVVYFNSQDAIILDTIEITPVPDVARAAIEDLVDSGDRLDEVLDWIRAH